MRCEDIQPLIGAWQDDELHGLTAWHLGRHIRRCAACSTEAATLMRLEERLRAVAPLGREEGRSTTTPRRRAWLAPASAGAAMAVIVASLALIYRDQSPTPPALGAISRSVLPVVRSGPTTTPVEAGRAQGLTSGFASSPQPKNRETVAAASALEPLQLRRVRRRARTDGRPRGRSGLFPRGQKTRRTDEPEVIVVAARTLTPAEIAERERDASEFIYVAATPAFLPPRSMQ